MEGLIPVSLNPNKIDGAIQIRLTDTIGVKIAHVQQWSV